MINPKDRQLVSVVTAILYGARMHSYDTMIHKVNMQKGINPQPPDIIDTTRIGVTIVHAVGRHIAPKQRNK